MNKGCKVCCGIGWVCERHPCLAFDAEIGCTCSEGVPCECNDSDPLDTSEVAILEIIVEPTLH
jgi:hypothetical protein